ncbi:MAG TPA: transposase [Steroidobacteraceae bacterium]
MATRRSRKAQGRQRFSREYKIEAVGLCAEGSKTVAVVAEELGIDPHQFYRWRRQFEKNGVTAFSANGSVGSHDEEVHRLRRELKRVSEERDFVNKDHSLFRQRVSLRYDVPVPQGVEGRLLCVARP